MKTKTKRVFEVPAALYKKFCEKFPLATVDFIIVRRGGGKQFLLGKRADRPYRGKWFIPGGRMYKGERFEDALARQFEREIGMAPGNAKFLFNHEIFNPPNNSGIRCHTILHVYLVEINGEPKKTLDNYNFGWFSKIDPRWPKPTKKMLEMAGFK